MIDQKSKPISGILGQNLNAIIPTAWYQLVQYEAPTQAVRAVRGRVLEPSVLVETLGMTEEEFNNHPAIPTGGDNKTLNRMWLAKRAAVNNTSEYAKLKHILPIPGLFHAQMHTLEAITKAHWGVLPKEGKLSQASLRYSSGRLGRRHVAAGRARYADSRTFIMDSVQSRIVAELLNHMNLRYHADNDEIKSQLNGYSIKKIFNYVRKTAASIKDFKGYKDLERLQNLRFLRDVEPYIVLCRGIQYGDIGPDMDKHTLVSIQFL